MPAYPGKNAIAGCPVEPLKSTDNVAPHEVIKVSLYWPPRLVWEAKMLIVYITSQTGLAS